MIPAIFLVVLLLQSHLPTLYCLISEFCTILADLQSANISQGLLTDYTLRLRPVHRPVKAKDR